MINSDELLFLCELIHIQPDREKRDILLQEVLKLLFEGQDMAQANVFGQSAISHVPSWPSA